MYIYCYLLWFLFRFVLSFEFGTCLYCMSIHEAIQSLLENIKESD